MISAAEVSRNISNIVYKALQLTDNNFVVQVRTEAHNTIGFAQFLWCHSVKDEKQTQNFPESRNC